MSVLGSHFAHVRKTLLAKADEAGVLRHGSSKGTARELVVSEFLKAGLPREFDFVSGEIAAPNGERSRQLDLMLIPHNSPRFALAPSVSLGLLHAVAAVIEVKSDLSTAPLERASELRNALDIGQSVRSLCFVPPLEPWPWIAERQETRALIRLEHIPFCLFAFKGPTIETLMEHLASAAAVNRAALPNIVTCLERDYTLVLNDGWIYDSAKLPPEFQQALYLRGSHSALVDLFDYLMKTTQAWAYARPRTPLASYI